MRIESAFCAHHVEVHDGLIYAMGAFPSHLNLPRFPCEGRFWLAFVLEMAPGERLQDAELDITLRRTRDGSVLVSGQWPLHCSTANVGDWPTLIPFAVQLGAEYDDVGAHRVELSLEGEHLYTIRFGVRLAEAAVIA